MPCKLERPTCNVQLEMALLESHWQSCGCIILTLTSTLPEAEVAYQIRVLPSVPYKSMPGSLV